MQYQNDVQPITDRHLRGRLRAVGILLGLMAALVVLSGCGNLRDQPKLAKPFDASPTFGRAARNILPEAVAVNSQRGDEHLYYGTVNGDYATTYPFPVTLEVLQRGKTQYEVFCTPCHGYSGYGDGIVSLEGFPRPASFHTDDLRTAPPGRIIQAMVVGKNAMYSYATRVQPEDRWAIAAYIQALQFSQYAEVDALPVALQEQLAALAAEAKEASRDNVSQ